MRIPLPERFLFILLCVVLMAATIYILGTSWWHEQENAASVTQKTVQVPEKLPDLVREAGMYRFANFALSSTLQPDAQNAKQYIKSERTLKSFYARRAYLGAPPQVPHEIKDDMTIGGSCLGCHEQGGYVLKMEAFAPVTPHPEMLNCRQCHEPNKAENLFQATYWQSVQPPKLKRSALPGSPPVVPHTLQMRENCLACHGGVAAVKEIRTSHPERINCRQCHMSLQTIDLFAPKRN